MVDPLFYAMLVNSLAGINNGNCTYTSPQAKLLHLDF